ncbi:uncharacterized protein LOC129780543 [Toxorhynchites rutilus septentrionalis]|uniref:uncharacterized protein LOC129780543 n=1 Tax=Toxorhynchites rutilus septentrionalis TaxID=329112 RepID=UPI00247A392D|nr:uncharacterized protein LOC129780543 [Toxorhynchites rutilus septentrionalis]
MSIAQNPCDKSSINSSESPDYSNSFTGRKIVPLTEELREERLWIQLPFVLQKRLDSLEQRMLDVEDKVKRLEQICEDSTLCPECGAERISQYCLKDADNDKIDQRESQICKYTFIDDDDEERKQDEVPAGSSHTTSSEKSPQEE